MRNSPVFERNAANIWNESVTVLPHISGPTTPETAAVIAVANVRRFLTTGELPADAMVDRVRGY